MEKCPELSYRLFFSLFFFFLDSLHSEKKREREKNLLSMAELLSCVGRRSQSCFGEKMFRWSINVLNNSIHYQCFFVFLFIFPICFTFFLSFPNDSACYPFCPFPHHFLHHFLHHFFLQFTVFLLFLLLPLLLLLLLLFFSLFFFFFFSFIVRRFRNK